MKVTQDFKMVIILDEDLPLGLKANTAAVLSLTVGNKIDDLIGEDLVDKDTYIHTGLTGTPLPILKCNTKNLKELYDKAYTLRDEILLVDITDAAQTTKNYDDYRQKLEQTANEKLQLLGIALAGSKKIINKLTGSLALLR